MGLLAVVYFGAAKLGLRLAFVNASASPVWPPTGIALAALLLYGYRLWPGIFLGAFLANLLTAGSFLTSLGIASGNTLEAVAGAWLVHRYANGCEVFKRPWHILKFLLLAALLSTMLSATLGVTSLALGGFADWKDFGAIWVTWWLGNAMGALVVTPLLVLWGRDWHVRWGAARTTEAILLLIGIFVLGQTAFGEWMPPGMRHYPLEFICLPVLTWAAFRFSPRETTAATLLLSGVAVAATLHGRGPFHILGAPNESLMLLQMFMGVTGVTMLMLACVVDARRRDEAALKELHGNQEAEIGRRTAELSLANRMLRAEIEERKQLTQALHEHENLLSESQQLAHVANWTWDLSSRKMTWSDELYRIYGLVPSEFPATYEAFLGRAHPADRDALQEAIENTLKTGRPFNLEHRVVRPDGSLRVLHRQGKVLLSTSGQVTGMVGTDQDVTEAKQAEEALRQRMILEGTLDAVVTANAQGVIIDWNPQAEKCFGWPRQEALGKSLSETLIPPAQRSAHQQDLEQYRTAGEGPILGRRIETTALRRDGTEFLVEMTVVPIRLNGQVIVSHFLRDITERKTAELTLSQVNEALQIQTQELQQQVQQTETLNEMSSVLRATLNIDELQTVVAKFVQALLPGVSGALCIQDPVKRTLRTAVTWGDAPPLKPEFTPDDCWALRRGHFHRIDAVRKEVSCGHMTYLPIGSLCAPMLAWGETMGILHVSRATEPFTDGEVRLLSAMTENVAVAMANLRLQEKLRWRADRDPLTGLFNRRYLDKVLSREMEHARKKHSPLCVVMLDLDRFKQFNDTYGHQAGDTLLQQVAALLLGSSRGRDIVCRYGGEEFTLLFPDSPKASCIRHVQRLQKAIKSLEVVHEGQTLASVSVSMGLAVFPEHGDTPGAVILAADQALYRAKAEGRDRLVMANGPEKTHPVPK